MMNLVTVTLLVLGRLMILVRLLLSLATMGLGLTALAWIVDQCHGASAELVVHVAESDVVLQVGDEQYPIVGEQSAPVVCRLEPGDCSLVLRRGDRVLYQEALVIAPGDHLVRTAWDEERLRNFQSKPAERPASSRSRSGTRRASRNRR